MENDYFNYDDRNDYVNYDFVMPPPRPREIIREQFIVPEEKKDSFLYFIIILLICVIIIMNATYQRNLQELLKKQVKVI